ncbi:hypothetical protein M8J76_011371 [Diaphorina citri]|nr:hypothetical protein M8J76_011371 [Diaphorina citri]
MNVNFRLYRQYVLVGAIIHISGLVDALTTVDLGGMASYEFGEFAYKCRKVIGAGLNYKKIIKERNLVTPKTPIADGSEVHHEVEMGIIISQRCKKVNRYDALNCIAGYCLALDLTEVRHLKHAREHGLPWTVGKGFDTACPVSDFIPEHEIKDPDDVPLWLKVNGELRQKSTTGDMLFKTGDLISYISQHMTLEPYDLILTGTPCGTGPLKVGDVVEAGLGHKDLVKVKFHVKEPEIPEENSENTEERLMTFPDFPTRTFPDFAY